MDAYAPTMMSVGARGMIGKGARLPEVVEAMKKYDGVYFGAIGGAGALLAKCIKKAELIAYEDLGAEALRKLYVEDMPLVVIIDSEGNNLYEEGRKHVSQEAGHCGNIARTQSGYQPSDRRPLPVHPDIPADQ